MSPFMSDRNAYGNAVKRRRIVCVRSLPIDWFIAVIAVIAGIAGMPNIAVIAATSLDMNSPFLPVPVPLPLPLRLPLPLPLPLP